MEEHVLIGISSVIVLGVAAQWIAWRFHLPSILLLLIAGFIIGPVTGFLNPDELLGETLFPFVSLSVGIVLFEGGLSLKLSELRGGAGEVVTNLITFGVLITWFGGAAAAHWIAGLDVQLSLLLAAILVVSGPTVIVPLLLHVRPEPRIGSIVKWEGIMNDPIGAILAVLVFQEIASGGLDAGAAAAVLELVETLLLGGAAGLIGGFIALQLLKRHLIPEFLHNPVMLGLVIADFAIANVMKHEAGLLSVTVMGVYLANQSEVAVKHIIEFKETLRTLIISTLFIILAARVEMSVFSNISIGSIVFVIVMMLVVRPLAVLASTYKRSISWQEKVFLIWMAPRGIVAAAVASLFALRLAEDGVAQAEEIVGLTFLVIASTVAIYGLTAGPVARLLHLAEPDRHGFLILGAHPWATSIAKEMQRAGLPLLVVDSNAANIEHAEHDGLDVYLGSILSEHALEEMNLGQIGKLLALTPNDEVNTLATFRVGEFFDAQDIYQLPFREDESEKSKKLASDLHGRLVFGRRWTYDELEARFDDGAEVRTIWMSEDLNIDELRATYGDELIPLLVIDPTGPSMDLFTIDAEPAVPVGSAVIALVNAALLDDPRLTRAYVDPDEELIKATTPESEGPTPESGAAVAGVVNGRKAGIDVPEPAT